MQDVTATSRVLKLHLSFLLTRLIRGVTSNCSSLAIFRNISTHTRHTRLDYNACKNKNTLCISTHTPHTRRDYRVCKKNKKRIKFLLTRLIRGVTSLKNLISGSLAFLLTRLIRGVTRPF